MILHSLAAIVELASLIKVSTVVLKLLALIVPAISKI